MCCSVLQCVAVCWQCVAACCREEDLLRDLTHLQRLAVVLLLQCVAVCCSVLQRVAEKRTCYEISHTCSASQLFCCCSVLQCVAVCCSVLQRRGLVTKSHTLAAPRSCFALDNSRKTVSWPFHIVHLAVSWLSRNLLRSRNLNFIHQDYFADDNAGKKAGKLFAYGTVYCMWSVTVSDSHVTVRDASQFVAGLLVGRGESKS